MQTIYLSGCRSHFTQLPNELLRNQSISLRSTGLLVRILSNASEWQVTKSWIEGQVKEGRDAISTCFRELESEGYARMVQKRNPKTNQVEKNVWTFFDSPLPESERSNYTRKRSAVTEAPPTGEPLTGNTASGEPVVKNTIPKEYHSTGTPSAEDSKDTAAAPTATQQCTVNAPQGCQSPIDSPKSLQSAEGAIPTQKVSPGPLPQSDPLPGMDPLASQSQRISSSAPHCELGEVSTTSTPSTKKKTRKKAAGAGDARFTPFKVGFLKAYLEKFGAPYMGNDGRDAVAICKIMATEPNLEVSHLLGIVKMGWGSNNRFVQSGFRDIHRIPDVWNQVRVEYARMAPTPDLQDPNAF